MERACEQALQLWQAKRATRTRALLIPASPFACDSRVTSRDSPQWTACPQANLGSIIKAVEQFKSGEFLLLAIAS